MALAATGYLFLGPGIYRKENGRHAMTTALLQLFPVLIGQHHLRCSITRVLLRRTIDWPTGYRLAGVSP